MIRVLSLDDLVRMTKEEFSVAWEEGTIHASVYESLGIEWEPVDENEEIVFAIQTKENNKCYTMLIVFRNKYKGYNETKRRKL